MTFPVTIQILAFVFGALLILIGVVGGGFEIKELRIPKVSIAGRVIAGIIGAFFLALAFGLEAGVSGSKDDPGAEAKEPRAGALEKNEASDDARKLAELKAAVAEEARAVAEQKAKIAEEAQRIAEQKAKMAEEMLAIAEQKTELAREAQRIAEEAREIAEQKAKAVENARAAEKKAAMEARSAAEKNARTAEEARKRQDEIAEQARAAAAEDAKSAAEARRIAEKEAMAAEAARKTATAAGAALEKFKIKSNRDMFGEDIQPGEGRTGHFAASIDECAAKCDATAACVAFAFDHWNKRCYPKREIVTSVLNPRSTIGVKNSRDLPNASTRAPEMKIVRDKRFAGTPIARAPVDDFDACRARCDKDLKCVAFNFLKEEDAENKCEIFNQSERGYFTDVSADGGWKQQMP